MCLCPVVGNLLLALAVIADLDREVRVGVVVVNVAPLLFLEELDEDFFVVPRLDGHVGRL